MVNENQLARKRKKALSNKEIDVHNKRKIKRKGNRKELISSLNRQKAQIEILGERFVLRENRITAVSPLKRPPNRDFY